ncbi:hypothetical protein ACFO3E_09120 [Sphingobium tyrosinilyticum]|jgi:hypothetical protein|uniref:Uncharacterized protein n=1 Tax=Sphingobium tyrosinilyticum TaxID=2715436 RepID=A0ABV9EZT6_9SPHN
MRSSPFVEALNAVGGLWLSGAVRFLEEEGFDKLSPNGWRGIPLRHPAPVSA